MESFIDNAARRFNNITPKATRSAIGEALSLSDRFKDNLKRKIKQDIKETPEEMRARAREEASLAIEDAKKMNRPEAMKEPAKPNNSFMRPIDYENDVAQVPEEHNR